jgi:arylsulfatase A-like enzyme
VAPAGATCDQYVSSVDFFPTMLEVAGLPARPDEHRDGMSFASVLKKPADEFRRGPIYWHYPHYGNQGGTPSAAVRDGDWKFIEFFEDGRGELYNLANDLGEQHNLADVDGDRAATMREQLHRWQEAVGARRPTPNPNYQPE